MPQFTVDEDLAALVERLAQPKPFENLSFNAALRRVLQGHVGSPRKIARDEELEQLFAESMAAARIGAKKAPTPSPGEWVATVSELKSKKGLTSWKAICDLLKIDTAGDSARRKLKNWVKFNRPLWPAVPDID
ncbi:MAG: hypothetical protein Q7K57_53315 [Burkholderiaceae bacterium]|nr:hypothetical protein [Burkholderiaceae bacterium]